MRSLKMCLIMFLAMAFFFSAGLAVAQETNTGGPANLAPGGLVPSGFPLTSPGIVVDMSPGTGSPPGTLGGFTMTPVPVPGAPGCTGITPPLPVPGGGSIGISPWDGGSRCIGSGWATWSHGYTGDVYFTGGGTSQTLTLPSGTKAVYFYIEPDPFSEQSFEAIAQPGGVSTGVFQVIGDSGARYVGFYATGSDTIQSIAISGSSSFAVGEFGWSGDGGGGECVEDDSGAIDIEGKRKKSGSVSIPVRIQSAPNAVASLGFEVTYPSVLTYTGYAKGALVEGFTFFDCSEPQLGIVRCGGFDSGSGISAGASGEVVSLIFEVYCD